MRATLKTLAVLLGIWLALAIAGVIGHFTIEGGILRAGSAPPAEPGEGDGDGAEGAGGEPETEAAGEAGREQAGADEDGAPSERGEPSDERSGEAAASAEPAATTSEGEPTAGEAEGAHAEAAASAAGASAQGALLRVCEEGSIEPSLSVVQMVGDARPELLVGCAEGWHLLGMRRGGAPMRIAFFSAGEAPAGTRQVTGRARVGDLRGDAEGDLLLPLARFASGGASRGGGLFMIPRGEFGGFGSPSRLASIAATAVAVGPMDGVAGNDLLALNQTNALAGLPSELWLFRGGPSPERQAVLSSSPGGVALAMVDLDLDEHTDAVAIADRSGKIDIHFADGQGAFPRSRRLELGEVDEAEVGDLDGDGHADLIVHAEGVVLVRATADASAIAPRRLGEAPSTMRGLQLLDIDGDSRLDVIGWDHPRLLALAQVGELSFEARVIARLGSGSFGPRRHALADLDGDGELDLIILGSTETRSASEAAPEDPPPLSLLLIPHILALRGESGGGEIRAPTEERPVEDAPLVLRVPLR